MRFVRYDHPVGHPDFGKAQRCHVCTEGNNVNPEKELRAVETYLRGYLAQYEAVQSAFDKPQ